MLMLGIQNCHVLIKVLPYIIYLYIRILFQYLFFDHVLNVFTLHCWFQFKYSVIFLMLPYSSHFANYVQTALSPHN